MAYDEKVQYLRRYQNTLLEIHRLEGEISRWRVLAAGSAASGDRAADTARRIAVCTDKRQRELAGLCALRDEIGGAISAVPDDRLARLLRLRYIDCMHIEEISEQEHMEYRWVRRLLHHAVDILTPKNPI